MRKKLLLFMFIGFFVIVLSGCGKRQVACTMEAKICPDGSAVSRNSDNDCEFNQCPQIPQEQELIGGAEQVGNEGKVIAVTTGNENIRIFGIEDGNTIKSPATIRGEGVAFENTLMVELRNSDHVALVKEYTNIHSGEVGKAGPFSITLNFSFQNTKEGYVAVYEQSAKDGSEEHLVEIPVKFEISD